MSAGDKLAMGIVARLQKAAKERGLKHAEIAEISGVPLGTVQKLMRGATDPQLTTMQKVVAALGQSMDYITLGVGDESGDWETVLPAPAVGEKRVPKRDVAASAGHGLEVFDEAPQSWFTFPIEWLMQMGDPDSMDIVRVEGDSMEPDLRDGDLVMIDRSQHQPKDGLCVVAVDGHLFLKRLRVKGRGRVELVSSNPNYPPQIVDIKGTGAEDCQDGAEIAGRVVWSCRRL